MDEPHNTFDLSPEQQHTSTLLNRLLGKAIADRYVDFCRLAAGAFALKVSRPMAAHGLRELDSMLRQSSPSQWKPIPEQPENAGQLDEARKVLQTLGCFDEEAIRRATDSLKPRRSHKTQIRKIVARLGLDPEGDVANRWIALCNSFGRAHERSFHRSLEVDDEFRSRYQEPLDTVIRAVVVALEGRYVALMQRVEEIIAMPNRSEAVAAFASEIPGALPLQWHFFKNLKTGDWLSHLARQGLLSEPMAGSEEANGSGFRYRQWPAGDYLQRMAGSADAKTRKLVADALHAVAKSEHPDVCHDGIEILAALPADESAPLADLAVAWLGRGKRPGGLMLAPEKLLKKLMEAKQDAAALRVARALLQIWKENGEVASVYGRHMYEHHLPSITTSLTQACGEGALQLFMELLRQAGVITGRLEHDHHSLRPVFDDDMARYDPYHALMSAVRRSAETLVADDPVRMRSVIDILTSDPAKVFKRLAMHVLSRNPSAAPELAEGYLLDPEFVGQTWAQPEYAALARAWFSSLSEENQRAVLAVVDAKPGKYREVWRKNFQQQQGTAPTAEDERVFEELTVRVKCAVMRCGSSVPLADIPRYSITSSAIASCRKGGRLASIGVTWRSGDLEVLMTMKTQ